ncbi:MAG: hypothetical protein ACI8ZX_002486 [Planctomycetota bacterium]|jgi:hypothetical protein
MKASKSLFKIIVLPSKFHKGYVAHFICDFIDGLKEKGWYVLDSDTDIKTSNILDDIYKATGVHRKPDILAFYILRKEKLFLWKNLKKLNCLKVLILEDLHRKIDKEAFIYATKWANVIFSRYPNATQWVVRNQKKDFRYYFNLNRNKIKYFNLYHGATNDFINELNFSNKINKVFLSGALSTIYYELREKGKQLMTDSDTIIIRKHPGYKEVIDSKKEVFNYAIEISKFKIAIGDQGSIPNSDAPYILAKNFEIPAAGTALITHEGLVPFLRELGFVENYNFIAANPDNLLDKIEHWLRPENQLELNKITIRGQELVLDKHMNEHRINFFNKKVIQLVDEKI